MIQDGRLYYGFSGENFVDLNTGETGNSDSGADLEAANRFVEHKAASVVYAQNGLYFRGELNYQQGMNGDRIYFAGEEDETETIVYEDSSLRRINIEMVTPQEIYFSADKGSDCLLMKLDLETGEAELLDSHPEAGSGGYFAW